MTRESVVEATIAAFMLGKEYLWLLPDGCWIVWDNSGQAFLLLDSNNQIISSARFQQNQDIREVRFLIGVLLDDWEAGLE